MALPAHFNALKERGLLCCVWAASILLDSLFLAMWAGAQWFVERVGSLVTSVIHLWVLEAFEAIFFALSTLFPVLIYVYTDIAVIICQARMTVRREFEREIIVP